MKLEEVLRVKSLTAMGVTTVSRSTLHGFYKECSSAAHFDAITGQEFGILQIAGFDLFEVESDGY